MRWNIEGGQVSYFLFLDQGSNTPTSLAFHETGENWSNKNGGEPPTCFHGSPPRSQYPKQQRGTETLSHTPLRASRSPLNLSELP